MRDLYEKNQSFHEYIDKYCVKHQIAPEIAFTHAMVRCAAEYYRHVNDGKISVSDVNTGGGAEIGGDCK